MDDSPGTEQGEGHFRWRKEREPIGAPRSLSRVYDRGLARATEDRSVADYIARGRSWRRRGTWRARQ